MPRLTASDIEKAIQGAKKDAVKEPTLEENEREVVCYSTNGKEVPEKNVNVFAKAVRIGEVITYFVLFNPSGRMFNAYGLFDESLRAKRGEGRKQFAFRKVTGKVFEFYLKFLETKNPSWLINAERESA